MTLVIFTLLALILPCYIAWASVWTIEDSSDPLWPVLRIFGSIVCVVMVVMGGISQHIVYNPRVNNAHQLSSLQGNTVYNVLEIFEDKRGKYDFNWKTYYWIEHLNGEVGLYYHTKTHNIQINGERKTLDYGYYSLKKYNYKLFFTTICKRQCYEN